MSEKTICDNCGDTEDDADISQCPLCENSGSSEDDYCDDCMNEHLEENHIEDLIEFYWENKDEVSKLKKIKEEKNVQKS